MFKRIKVITLLVSVLLVLGAMQIISAGVFINALNNDKDNFTVSQVSSQNVAEFTDAWISLNQARVTLNRGMLRLQSSTASQINGGQLSELVATAKNLLANAQGHYDKYYALPETPGMDENLGKQLEEQYRVYSSTLAQMNSLLAQGNLEDMFKQNAESKQQAMQKVYREWREAQAKLTNRGIADNEKDYQRILWILSAIMIVVVGVIIGGIAMKSGGDSGSGGVIPGPTGGTTWVAGVGGGGTFAALIVLSTLNFPIALVGVMIAIEPLVDMGRTALNVNGSIMAAMITKRLLGKQQLAETQGYGQRAAS